MKTYKAMVRLRNPSGGVLMTLWTQVAANSAIQARQLLEVQYGRGSVVGVPVPI